MYCKLCDAEIKQIENGLCELCIDRIREEKEELKADREISKTEEIFGSEGAYWSYKEGNLSYKRHKHYFKG